MKLLFLDFDGVIFTIGGNIHDRYLGEKTSKWERDPVAFSLIRYLLDKNDDLFIIVSSTWRLGHSLEELKEILGPLGSRVLGMTPSSKSGYRGYEIDHFLKTTPLIVEDFIIIDDDSDMNPHMGHLFKTDSFNGMTYRNMREIELYLQMTPAQRRRRRIKTDLYFNARRIYWTIHYFFKWTLFWKVKHCVAKLRKRN